MVQRRNVNGMLLVIYLGIGKVKWDSRLFGLKGEIRVLRPVSLITIVEPPDMFKKFLGYGKTQTPEHFITLLPNYAVHQGSRWMENAIVRAFFHSYPNIHRSQHISGRSHDQSIFGHACGYHYFTEILCGYTVDIKKNKLFRPAMLRTEIPCGGQWHK